MEREEAKLLVEKELENCGIGGIFAYTERNNHMRYIKEDMLDVSIQVSNLSEVEVNVYVDFQIGDIDYELSTFKATPQSIAKLFAEYKRIKGE